MTQERFIDKQISSLQLPEDTNDKMSKTVSHIIDKNNSLSSKPINDLDGRIDFLERNLSYIQQQHEITLNDLHNEIDRLEQENRDLQHHLINTHPISTSKSKQRNTNQISSISDKHIDENHVQLKQEITELEKQLIKTERQNKDLLHTIDELNKIISSKVEISDTNSLITDDTKIPTEINDNDSQQLITITYEKQQQYLQEIIKLRSVLYEILQTERLSITSKILLHDCLTSTKINEISMHKTTTTPVDMLFMNENQQQKHLPSLSIAGKTISLRPLTGPQRIILPPITQENSSPLLQIPFGMNGLLHNSLSPTSYSQQQHLLKMGETSIARRERRTHELQKNRLTRNLYH